MRGRIGACCLTFGYGRVAAMDVQETIVTGGLGQQSDYGDDYGA